MLIRSNKRKLAKVCIVLLLVVAFSLPQVSSLRLAQADTTSAERAQAVAQTSSALNEQDIVYMILTDRFYDADPSNNGVLGQEYRPGQLRFTQGGGDWKGITQKLDYVEVDLQNGQVLLMNIIAK